ncbi:MAG TPA: tetratricopeptide repeat protein [Pyrinomonadaceae bacterium]|nr:tetratricopeptide repeat protein [Pyrinomonadaceae bacterium]
MSRLFTLRLLQRSLIVSLVLAFAAAIGAAQNEAAPGDDPDPVRLFERAQAAHARGDFDRALALYDEALKVRPEFPEAEFQKGTALLSLNRLAEAEPSFRRAIQLRNNWALPYSALGVLLTRLGRDAEGVSLLQQALQFDKDDGLALRVLASLKLRAGDTAEALRLAQRATHDADAPAAAWLIRAQAERAAKDNAAAKTSLNRALQLEPENVAALVESADLALDQNDYDSAIVSLEAANRINKGDKQIASRLALAHERAGRTEEARRIATAAGIISEDPAKPHIEGTAEEIAAANNDDPLVSRKALEKLIEKNPRNAMLFARLGASYRTENPNRALEFYHRASELQPANPDYATGYAAALVRARRFAQAAAILRQVIGAHPDNYTAHANLATALYEQKLFAEALPEYEWLLRTKPDAIVAYYFIASAHDYLGEYREALAAYESFLERADATTNQLEIEKVRLRLPLLRRQVKRGEGVKRKP